MNKQQEPRLRFKNFTGAWEEKKVIDFSPLQRGFDLPVSKITEGDYPVVFSNGILKSHNQYKVKGVGIVTGRSGTIGEVTFVEKDFWPHNTALWVTNFFGNNPQFVFHFLKNFDLSRFATGSGVPTLNRNDVHNQTIYVPKFEEQTALGNFFRRLDSQIAESRAVLEKSRQLKKAMLAKMFPANGEKIPKIRFKGFEGEWECRKLGDLMNVTSVKRIHQSDWTNEGVRFLRARDIVAFNKGEKIEEPLFISKEKYNEYSEISGKVKIGDLLVTGVGTIGVPYLIEDENPLYFKDGNVIWFQNENKIGGLFFYYSFLNNFIQDFIIETAGIGTVGTYTIDTGKKTPIFLPPTESEQTAIGNFFRQLDENIALQSAEVEKLNQLKKGLLAAMLV